MAAGHLGELARPEPTGDPVRDLAASSFQVFDVVLDTEDGRAVILDGTGHAPDEIVTFVTHSDAPHTFVQYPGLASVIRVEQGLFAWRDDELVESPRGRPVTLVTEIRKTALSGRPVLEDDAPDGPRMFVTHLNPMEAAA
ncbi:hypothetical protein [Agromyces humi]|uniref:hypothetical protein n=1 Tax=Agromyces humi TaxID=1766800 RepID=UPI0013587A31|nr:hypothetical protein [Agromyces humi]